MAIRFEPNNKILIWHSKGQISISEITLDIDQIVKLEKANPSFNYFLNASDCDLINIKFEEIRQIYLLRNSEKIFASAKTAIFVKTTLQYGVARIYQTLMSESKNRVEVFKTQKEYSGYLEVPIEILFKEN
jgi:hypothetical protein